MRKEFIKNVLDVEVNGFAYTIRYIVRTMYNVIDDYGFTTIEQKIIEDVTLSDEEIEEESRASKVLEDLKECYAPLCCN
nr:hypothetical protein [uncultured Roseburia sp.]